MNNKVFKKGYIYHICNMIDDMIYILEELLILNQDGMHIKIVHVMDVNQEKYMN